MTKKIDLYKHVQELRLAASSIYDRLKASDAKEEDIQKELEPFQDMLQKSIEHAVNHDLDACVRASREFRHHAEAHEAMAKMYIQKALDSKEHAALIEQGLVNRMVKESITELQEGSSSATLVTAIDGSKVLNLR